MTDPTAHLDTNGRLIYELREALAQAEAHLEYCGYGDAWERECARAAGLELQITTALDKANKFLEDL